MPDTYWLVCGILICAAATMLVRILPYLVFGGAKKLPPLITRLGTMLPSAIMVILVVYCLRGTKFSAWPFGLPEALAVTAVIILQLVKKNTILSITAGTALYMLLSRTVFL